MSEEKKDQDFNVQVINLASYTKPEVIERYNQSWIEYGEFNDFFNTLIDRYSGSPTNNRCINGIVDMIYGRGLNATDSEFHIDMYAKMKVLLKEEDLKRLINDFYLLGMGAMMVQWNRDKNRILRVYHHPMETLRAGVANKQGFIKKWYYHPNWLEKKRHEDPKMIPSFKHGSKTQRTEVYIFKPYKSGYYYYAPPAYLGCLQYAQLEEEVSNYHISNIMNGLAPSLLVNFNNGVPPEEKKRELEQKIYKKFSGTSNSGKAIISFNDDKESESTIEPIHLPDAHAQYQFLSDEAREKIMLGHGIVSPILLGIKDNTGFGNNAEELRTASILMDNMVIRPPQEELIKGFNEILIENGIKLDLYFTTLQPIEFTELDNIATKVKREEETGWSCEDVI
jgi:hypothetical protein